MPTADPKLASSVATGIALVSGTFVLLHLLTGCARDPLTLNARQQEVRAALARRDPRTDPQPASTRIIDIHTHTFNGRYLPFEGVLLGKRDVSPVARLLSDSCAKTLAQALIDRTELAAAAGEKALRRPPGRQFLEPQGGLACRLLIGLLNKAEERGCWDKSVPPDEQVKQLRMVAEEMSPGERIAVRTMMDMMGMQEETNEKGTSGLVAAVRFIWQTTQDDARMMAFFRRDFHTAPMKGSPLMVSHMMDLGPVYDEPARGRTLLDFSSSQIPRMEDFQNRTDSGLIYFVAYNPYRDHWHGGKDGDALRIVQDAIRHHGAWGVKFYPPSGYRAAGNEVPKRPKPKDHFAVAQWKARYGPLGNDGAGILNRRAEHLLEWCIQQDIPVFVHCSTGEFEAQKGYGASNSNPKFWRQFLKSHPAPDGGPCPLRLCLGHAGSGDYWFGQTKYASWGKEVASLCREYPNVYCEVTAHAELAKPDEQAYFADLLIQEFAKEKAHPGAHFQLRKKLMYGTDWYLPDASDRAEVLVAAEQAFLHNDLRSTYEDYFAGNAARYLNIAQRLPTVQSPAVRERLLPFAKYDQTR